jgi:hypothetical protein
MPHRGPLTHYPLFLLSSHRPHRPSGEPHSPHEREQGRKIMQSFSGSSQALGGKRTASVGRKGGETKGDTLVDEHGRWWGALGREGLRGGLEVATRHLQKP